MKLKNIISVSCLSLMVIFATASCDKSPQLAQGEYLIRGHISSVEDGDVVHLMKKSDKINGGADQIAQDTIIDGMFEFRGAATGELDSYYIRASDEKYSMYALELYVSPKTYAHITGDGYNIMEWDIESNNPYQRKLNKILEYGRSNMAEAAEISILYRRLVEQASREYENGNTEGWQQRRDEMEYYSSLLKMHSNIFIDKKLSYLEKAKVDKVWIDQFVTSAYYIRNSKADSTTIATCERLYKKLPASYLSTENGAMLTASLFPPEVVEVSEPMADALLYDVNDKEYPLSSFLGKYILLDFWRDGCSPCISSFGESERVAQKYADKLTIISITQDDKEHWLETLERLKPGGLQMREESTSNLLAKRYGVQGVPGYVLISPSGIVMHKWSGYYDGYLEQTIFRHLGAK